MAFKKDNKVVLKSRNNKKLNQSYPIIEQELQKQSADNFIIDGEVAAFSGNVSDFARLQARMHIKDRQEALKSRVAVYYYVFDLIYYDQYELSALPLRKRKSLLKKIIRFKKHLRYTVHRTKKTEKYYQQACKKGWEGLIVKKAGSAYEYKRSSDWLKFKCVREQELVIGGYTHPQGERKGFGSLLVGYYENHKLKYAGKVGTGFDEETLKDLSRKMNKLKIDYNPFDSQEAGDQDVNFIKPNLVCQVGFTEWTGGNRLRHPRFFGLRRDKQAEKVKKEA